jgi:ATP-binding cassette subfamily B protein
MQDTCLFAASAGANIAFGKPGATEEEIQAAARLANADCFVQALPQGYETVLGERGATLSGGQRQRLAIARAAIRQAPILIFDEPATGLDEENQRTILDALEHLGHGKTTIFITHDLRQAKRADCIYFLEHGAVAEQGTHEELMQSAGRYAALYRMQTSRSKRTNGVLVPSLENGERQTSEAFKTSEVQEV